MTFIGLIIIFLCVLLVFRLPSWNCSTRQSASTASTRPATSSGPLPMMLLSVVLLFVLLLATSTTTVRQDPPAVPESPLTAVEISGVSVPRFPPELQPNLRAALRQLSEARDGLREAVQPLSQVSVNAASTPEDASGEQRTGGLSGKLSRWLPGTVSVGDVLVLDLSTETAERMVAEQAAHLVRDLQRQLPDGLSQTWALVPLSAPGAPVSRGSSLAAADLLRLAAESITSALKDADSPTAVEQAAVETAQSESAAPGSEVLAELPDVIAQSEPAVAAGVPAEQSENDLQPEWVRNPEGGRLVVETPFVLSEADTVTALSDAVNDALIVHLQNDERLTARTVRDWPRLVKLELDAATLQQCIVDTYQRREILDTRDGPQSMLKTVALVEFSESVDHAALDVIRQEAQDQRAGVIAVVMMLIWSAVVVAGLLLRFGIQGRRLRRVFATLMAVIIVTPVILVSLKLVHSSSQGSTFAFPWHDSQARVVSSS